MFDVSSQVNFREKMNIGQYSQVLSNIWNEWITLILQVDPHEYDLASLQSYAAVCF